MGARRTGREYWGESGMGRRRIMALHVGVNGLFPCRMVVVREIYDTCRYNRTCHRSWGVSMCEGGSLEVQSPCLGLVVPRLGETEMSQPHGADPSLELTSANPAHSRVGIRNSWRSSGARLWILDIHGWLVDSAAEPCFSDHPFGAYTAILLE